MEIPQDNHIIYIKNKVDDYFENFTYENANRLIDFYEDVSFPIFKEYFSSIHFNLNKLFKHLNTKSKGNKHYNAHESRRLLLLIEELLSIQSTLKNTKYYFSLTPYYKEILDRCEKFLVDSNGSPIPEDFPHINLIDAEPIFTFDTQVSITRADKKNSFPTTANKGVLHRDISTKNILVKKYEGLNVIKVSDFGLVKLETSVLTNKDTTIKGYFNDPKLELIGFDKYSILHETYALTRIVYFVITGKVILSSYQNDEFKHFIENGLADNPNDRYKDVEEMQDAFNKIVHTLS